MARVKIDKIRMPNGMSTEDKLDLIIKHIFALEYNLEYILTHLSDENFKGFSDSPKKYGG